MDTDRLVSHLEFSQAPYHNITAEEERFYSGDTRLMCIRAGEHQSWKVKIVDLSMCMNSLAHNVMDFVMNPY